ncbi:predicted protein [Streptomyces viridosporus ATCC 14672]|uniref:Predicted protein n=1 Tax=Streptomyces viridosporus (strain ATCC 14672 / DSM 40746 / JCM 4963 / KCTC 9882 / NRRL B-12104 / FH 1290) TaxID=566461 RepID=D5ZWC7_STRV1|nr:predicted protein [Streptomyces viridosporus ATCC 14672]
MPTAVPEDAPFPDDPLFPSRRHFSSRHDDIFLPVTTAPFLLRTVLISVTKSRSGYPHV